MPMYYVYLTLMMSYPLGTSSACIGCKSNEATVQCKHKAKQQQKNRANRSHFEKVRFDPNSSCSIVSVPFSYAGCRYRYVYDIQVPGTGTSTLVPRASSRPACPPVQPAMRYLWEHQSHITSLFFPSPSNLLPVCDCNFTFL